MNKVFSVLILCCF
uniref:Uncharacterized protein n=1 Tax=Anguilla anguilla TaxID=7936 RepID=A0A0E9UTL2_ANGAN